LPVLVPAGRGWQCAGVTSRLKGRRRQALAAVESVTTWALSQKDVRGLALVGSYAYGRPRMASDVDLVLLTTDAGRHITDIGWISDFDPRARLIRTKSWGPLAERRVRLRSGLQVELGVVPPDWASLPLDRGTARVLRHGCRVLHDPDDILSTAIAAL
jgi:uncharacterized protein